MATFAAVDLGASSGRVMACEVGDGVLELREAHRFPNDPVRLPSGLHWDVLRLHHEVLAGLRVAASGADLTSIGIDSWAIDYGLVDAGGALIANPHHYRDERTNHATAGIAPLTAEQLYAINGLQHLPFATVHQLCAEAPSRLGAADHLALIPDLLTEWLTGTVATEITNASTTGLLDATTRHWSGEVLAAIGLPRNKLSALITPGTSAGPLRPMYQDITSVGGNVPVIAVGSHDTASAVVAVPSADHQCAYISCGTWGLVGVELERPVITEASRTANFTNELGVDGRVRFLRNVTGLWLLQESLRTWAANGAAADIAALVAAAAQLPAGGPIIDVDDPGLQPPGDMPARIAAACTRSGQRPPTTQAQTARCILDSLAVAFARTVRQAAALSGTQVGVVHLVGGGSRNQLLCQLTADACALPVVAGPVEATALGNVLVQARAAGTLTGSLEALRACVRATQPLHRYEPRPTVHR